MSLTQGINQRTLTIGGRMTEQLVFILRRLDLTNKKLFIYGETVESKRVKLETSRKPYGDPSPLKVSVFINSILKILPNSNYHILYTNIISTVVDVIKLFLEEIWKF